MQVVDDTFASATYEPTIKEKALQAREHEVVEVARQAMEEAMRNIQENRYAAANVCVQAGLGLMQLHLVLAVERSEVEYLG